MESGTPTTPRHVVQDLLAVVFIFLSLCMPVAPASGASEAEEIEETVTLEQLPAAVRQTIEKETAGGTVTELVKEVEEGKTLYEAEFTKDGKAFEVEVAEDGTLLSKEEDEGDDEDEGDQAPDGGGEA